jgi:hypothetical protein
MSNSDLKSDSTLTSKGTIDLNGKLNVKESENWVFPASNVDLAGCSTTAPQILEYRLWKYLLFNHSSAASKINAESISIQALMKGREHNGLFIVRSIYPKNS